MDYFLATSNKEKIAQYHKFGCPYPGHGGPDLPEPDSDIATIVGYKSAVNGPGAVTEDTCLHIEDCEYNGNLIRFIEKNLHAYEGHKAVCEIALGRHNGEEIEVFIAQMPGVIVADRSDGKAYGFDGFFVPDGTDKTLWEHILDGNHALYSVRRMVLDKMMANDITCVKSVSLKDWDGPWQNDEIEDIPAVKKVNSDFVI